MVTPLSLRAAQYLRMSTDMQQYSLNNQSLAIAAYAARRGMSIVQTYEDAGKSGLTASQRPGLQSLIEDVCSGAVNFRTVLVLDVSRWGRFQDCDESAHYEYLCKAAGVQVEYCVELFENDGSLAATVLKNIKRAMAGEYSRELSAKVFAGQINSVIRGNYIGSKAGYGLRRCIVDELGRRQFELKAGQRKTVSTHRTILVPGPQCEIDVIHDVYAMFLDEGLSIERIVSSLNEGGILNAEGRKWNGMAVRDLLSNEKYAGSAIFNRTSKKLRSRFRKNPKSEWIRTEGAFDPVVSIERFQKAQQQLSWNAQAYTDNELLDSLSALWCTVGRLSAGTVSLGAFSPCVNAYKEHFGSLVEAYRKIGYRGHYDTGNSPDIRKVTVATAVENLRRQGHQVEHQRNSSDFTIDSELHIEIITSKFAPSCGKSTWHAKTTRRPDLLVIVRVDSLTSTVREYLLVPVLLLGPVSWLTISKKRNARLNAFRHSTLEPLYRLCERVRLH